MNNKPLSLFGSPPPPKEGRYHSQQYQEKRKNTMFKVVVGALVLAVTYIIYTSAADGHAPSRHLERVVGEASQIKESVKNSVSKPVAAVEDVIAPVVTAVAPKPAGKVTKEKPKASDGEVEPPAEEDKPKPKKQKVLDTSDDDDEKTAGKVTYGKQATAHQVESKESKQSYQYDNSNFKKDLKRLFEVLPDEIHVRELLRIIEGTGKEKLRETGLRARAFKNFFEAWEKMHLVRNGDEVYVRDDIVQELRSDSSLSENIAQTIHQYESYRAFLQRMSQLLFPYVSPYFADLMSLHAHFHKGGRGIVFTAGDEQAPFLLTSIPSFRKLGCNLPIEVMYLGDADLSEDYRAELEQMPGVVTRDISLMIRDEGWRLAGWAAKPFAMLLSSFREVIFIDADALFFKNPEVLFDDAGYKKTGALFFKDRLIMPEVKKRWLQQILPKPISKQVRQSRFWTGESGHMQESGVVVVDKWKHFVAMLMVTRMNGPDRDGNESAGLIGVYDMVYGDKETFWIGWELVGDTEYSFHQGDAGIMGELKTPTTDAAAAANTDGWFIGKPDGAGEHVRERGATGIPKDDSPAAAPSADTKYTICAPQLLHLDLEGKPLWFNGWILNNKFADKRAKKANKFDFYLREPHKQPDSEEPDAWQLTENNICCLSTDETLEFTKQEDGTLHMIADLAQAVGAYGKKGK